MHLQTFFALATGASAAAIQSRQDSCSGCATTINVNSDVTTGSGSLGQLDDGQNRVGSGYGAVTYCFTDGSFTDSSGRGCILTSPTTQFQCDTGATPQNGFTISSTGAIEYNGDSTFYECQATDDSYNIYTVAGGTNCTQVTLTATNSDCFAPAPSSTLVPVPGTTVGPGSTVIASSVYNSLTSAATPAGATCIPTSSYEALTSAATPAGATCVASSVYDSITSAATPASATCLPSSVYDSITGAVTPAGATCIASSVYSSLTAAPATITSVQTVTIQQTVTQSLAPATVPATPVAQSTACPASLAAGAFQTPHLIVPVSSTAPDTAYGTSYNGCVNSTVDTLFNFDIPTSYAGQTCSLVFFWPTKDQLETSDYTTSGSGAIDVEQLSSPASQATTFNTVPAVSNDLGTFNVTPGSSTIIASGACAAGQTVGYEVSARGDFALEYFQDSNPSPIGLFVVAC